MKPVELKKLAKDLLSTLRTAATKYITVLDLIDKETGEETQEEWELLVNFSGGHPGDRVSAPEGPEVEIESAKEIGGKNRKMKGVDWEEYAGLTGKAYEELIDAIIDKTWEGPDVGYEQECERRYDTWKEEGGPKPSCPKRHSSLKYPKESAKKPLKSLKKSGFEKLKIEDVINKEWAEKLEKKILKDQSFYRAMGTPDVNAFMVDALEMLKRLPGPVRYAGNSSYSYTFNPENPLNVEASDGSEIKLKCIMELEDYSEGFMDDMLDLAEGSVPSSFKQGYVDQEKHELEQMGFASVRAESQMVMFRSEENAQEFIKAMDRIGMESVFYEATPPIVEFDRLNDEVSKLIAEFKGKLLK